MDYIKLALNESKKAFKRKEVPIGAVLVYNGEVIAKSYNKNKQKHLFFMHAEIDCIIKASKKMKTWNLQGFDLYVTLKPCDMCTIFIKHSRISNVYYLLDKLSEKKEYNKTNFVKIEENDIEKDYKNLLQQFFSEKR